MLDRIDMHVHLPRVSVKDLQRQDTSGEKSEAVRRRVEVVRQRQVERYNKLSSDYSSAEIDQFCRPDNETLEFLEAVCERLNMSARAYHRILKLARTIADMAESEVISIDHVSEAVGLRALDRG